MEMHYFAQPPRYVHGGQVPTVREQCADAVRVCEECLVALHGCRWTRSCTSADWRWVCGCAQAGSSTCCRQAGTRGTGHLSCRRAPLSASTQREEACSRARGPSILSTGPAPCTVHLTSCSEETQMWEAAPPTIACDCPGCPAQQGCNQTTRQQPAEEPARHVVVPQQ